MKFFCSVSTKPFALMLAAAAVSIPARAQVLEDPDTAGWFARLGAVARFNIKATMEAGNPVLPAGHFDNGFVLPDVGGSPDLTWNWGYNNASQVTGDSINFHRYDNVPAVGRHNLDLDDPLLGGEIIAGYRFTDYEFLNRTVRVAVLVGYGFMETSQNMGYAAAGNASYTAANYPLNGVIPPTAPYAGTAAGPGPLLSLAPTSSVTSTSAANTAFSGSIDATFHLMRLGPSFEMDLTDRFSLEVGVGYATIFADATVDYTETTAFANAAVPAINTNTSFDRQDWEPGIYFEVLAKYRFHRYISAYLGGDYQRNNSLKFADVSHKVRIDLSSTYAAKAGVIVNF